MQTKIMILIVALCTLVGCARHRQIQIVQKPENPATIKLAEAADSISNSLHELARIQKVATPAKSKPLVTPYMYSMQRRASVDWSGPIQPLIKQISKAANFKLRVLGKRPPLPVLIDITAQNATLGDLLRDADFQAAKKANIKIDKNHRVIELRYAKA